MPADVITVREFKSASSHWSQKRSWHKGLTKLDNALLAYHSIPKQNIESRIASLKRLYKTCHDYAEDKKLFVWQDTRRRKKISASEVVYNQAAAKIKYLNEVLLVEKRLPAMFGVGDKTPVQKASTAKGKWQALIKQVQGLQEYIGKTGDGRQLHESYWTEAVDPMHTNWKHPTNSPVFQEWVKLRHEDKTTSLSFYRWMETLTDGQLHDLVKGDLLHTQYQDEVGREQYRVFFADGKLKHLKTPDEMALWGTDRYKTNFLGTGWAIFVMSPDGRLYANNHDDTTGWFHAAFLGGKPVKAAGELYVRDGVPLVMTDKSGHYKPQFSNLADAAQALHQQGVEIGRLQLWSRYVDPTTNSIFSGQAGMRGGGIWYQSIDAKRWNTSHNRGQSMLYDFGLAKSGFVITTPKDGKTDAHSLKGSPAFLSQKNTLKGYSIEKYHKKK